MFDGDKAAEGLVSSHRRPCVSRPGVNTTAPAAAVACSLGLPARGLLLLPG